MIVEPCGRKRKGKCLLPIYSSFIRRKKNVDRLKKIQLVFHFFLEEIVRKRRHHFIFRSKSNEKSKDAKGLLFFFLFQLADILQFDPKIIFTDRETCGFDYNKA